MLDTPKVSDNYNINKNNIEYIISLIHLNSSLEIKISTKKPFQKSSYQKVFSFDDLKHVSNYFSLFKNLSDIIPNIKAMLENEKTRDLGVDANSKIIKLILIPPIMNIDKIIFAIPEKEINKDEIIQELIKTNSDLLARVDSLEKEVKEIKEILELNNIKKKKYKKIESTIIKNDEENEFIINCIGKENLEFERIYKMSEDGDRDAFHKKCDNQGPTLCLFKIKDKDIRYGGFASVSWDSYSKEKRDENAFIFSINNKKMFSSTNYDSSIFCRNDYGPFFGGNNHTKSAELWFCEGNNCGFYNNKIYKDSNKECTGGLRNFKLDELEVFKVKNYL